MLHSSELEKLSLSKETKKIKEEAATGAKLNSERRVNFHQINKNTASIGGMRSLIKKTRQFRENAIDRKQKNIIKFRVMR